MALVSPDGRFLKVNPSVCQITGYNETELLERNFQEITHADDLEVDLAWADKLLAGEVETYQVEKRYLHKNGSTVSALLSVSLARDKNKEPLFFVSQIQDITRQKLSEQQLNDAAAEIARLRQGLLKICAWTKRIEIDSRWITVDEFLRDHLHLQLTHGMSVEGARLFHRE